MTLRNDTDLRDIVDIKLSADRGVVSEIELRKLLRVIRKIKPLRIDRARFHTIHMGHQASVNLGIDPIVETPDEVDDEGYIND